MSFFVIEMSPIVLKMSLKWHFSFAIKHFCLLMQKISKKTYFYRVFYAPLTRASGVLLPLGM